MIMKALAAGAAWQRARDRAGDGDTDGGNGVLDVSFRPDGEIRGAGSRRVWEVRGRERLVLRLRGESRLARRPGIRKLRCRGWHDGESRSIRDPRSVQARVPA